MADRADDGTIRLEATATGIAEAARLLRTGALVAFPTETVYGLGADARSEAATAAIFAAKGRPAHNPLIVHCTDQAAAERLVDLPGAAARLAERHWPGPLTLVLPARADAGLAAPVHADLSTVAVRVPAHAVAQALLAATGLPLAAPSANPSGAVSPTTADHVLEGLKGQVTAVLDAGPCAVGIESTIIGFAEDQPILLRPGGLTQEQLAASLGAVPKSAAGGAIQAPGQLQSHYAPRARLRLDAIGPEADEAWLGLGPVPPTATGPAVSLSESGDLTEAAARLFAALRNLDAVTAPGGTIAVGPIPRRGLGLAINDRLARAAAPRPG
ncbi:MAG: L-threonylcarbamoyladenylate synthase [Pseudomonadota bacterium]